MKTCLHNVCKAIFKEAMLRFPEVGEGQPHTLTSTCQNHIHLHTTERRALLGVLVLLALELTLLQVLEP